jgi:capsular polysaccharide biosynthesis protein/Mrp family chromosome partitioning ATPase
MAEQESLTHSVQRYVMVLRRQWWVALVVTAVALAAAILYVERATPVYSASMKVVVGQGQTLATPSQAVDIQSYTQTITDLLQSQVVARQTIQRLGLNENATTLLASLGVSAGPNTSVIDVTYDDTNQPRAVRILSTLGGIFTSLVNSELGSKAQNSAQAAQAISVVVFDPAHADPGRVSPRTTRTLAIALVLGLVAGLLLALLRDALSGRIRNEEEAESAYGAHVIGALPRGTLGLPTGGHSGLPPKLAARMSDTFQMLTARLRYSNDLERGVIVVTGARPEDGKSTVSAHIAAVLAMAGNDVIAVEADLHRPALCRLLGIRAGRQGVRELITQDLDLESLLVEVSSDVIVAAPQTAGEEREPLTVATAATGPDARRSRRPATKPARGPAPVGRLRLLPAGLGTQNPGNILALGNSSPLVSRLRDTCDYVVIDTPPLLLSGDAYPLVQLADAVLVVSKERSSTVEDARRMRKILRSLGVHDFSLVVSESQSVSSEDYYAYSDAR